MAGEIIVWTRGDTCQPCRLTKKALLDSETPFTERALEDATPEQLDAFRARGFLTAPVVETNTHGSWAGFNPGKLRALTSPPPVANPAPHPPAPTVSSPRL